MKNIRASGSEGRINAVYDTKESLSSRGAWRGLLVLLLPCKSLVVVQERRHVSHDRGQLSSRLARDQLPAPARWPLASSIISSSLARLVGEVKWLGLLVSLRLSFVIDSPGHSSFVLLRIASQTSSLILSHAMYLVSSSYFRKGPFFGLACFANMPVESELERGARMKSVGILSPSYTLLYRYMHFLENQVRYVASVHVQGGSRIHQLVHMARALGDSTCVPERQMSFQEHPWRCFTPRVVSFHFSQRPAWWVFTL